MDREMEQAIVRIHEKLDKHTDTLTEIQVDIREMKTQIKNVHTVCPEHKTNCDRLNHVEQFVSNVKSGWWVIVIIVGSVAAVVNFLINLVRG